MKKSKLMKVGKEIEYIKNPQEGKLYLADPRQFEVSEDNPRGKFETGEQLRYSKNLEKSILHAAIQFPLTSDMDFKIVAGGRRLELAKKHRIKVPVIFRRFEDRKEKLLASFLDNDPLPLNFEERRYIVEELLKEGLTLKEIANKLGMKYQVAMNIINPPDMPTRLEEVLIETFGEKAVENAKDQRRRPKTESAIKGAITHSKIPKEDLEAEWRFRVQWTSIPFTERKEAKKALSKGEPLNFDFMREIRQMGFVEINLKVFITLYSAFIKKMKRRNWDKRKVLLKAMEMICLDEIEITQARMDEGWRFEDLKGR